MNYFTLVFFLVVSFFGPVLGAVGGSKKAPPPLKPRPKLELLETEEEKQGATYARDEDFVKAAEEYEEYMDKRPQGWKLKKGMPAIDEEIDRKWVSLEELSKEVKPQDTLNALKANDPALWRSLCIKIKDPNFYEWASTNGVGTFKRNAMISGCENFTRDLEQVRTREAKQGPKMPGDGRENAGLQSFLDKKRQEREKKAKLEQQKAAALKIQNVVRMHLARTKHSDGLQAQKEKIHQEAEEQKRLEEERIRTQEEDERLAEEQKRDDNSRRRMNAINTMEGQLREKRERIQQQAKAEEEGEAATKIQSAFRGFSQRKKFKEMKAAEEKRQRQEAARKAEEERKRVKEEQRRSEEERKRDKEEQRRAEE